MRRILVAVLALGLAVALKAPSYAAFTSMQTVVLIGSTTFTGAGAVNMSVAWNSGTQMTFAGIVLGTTQWKASTNYLIITSTMTDATGGIQIYTNNRNAVAPYRYLGSTTTSAAGLVMGTQLSTNTVQALPMCWRVSASTLTATIMEGAPGFPDRLWDAATGNQFPCYLYMLDRTDAGFTLGMGYAEVRDALLGIQFAEATWGAVSTNRVLVYLGANFANAMTANSGITYATTTLTLEAFHE